MLTMINAMKNLTSPKNDVIYKYGTNGEKICFPKMLLNKRAEGTRSFRAMA